MKLKELRERIELQYRLIGEARADELEVVVVVTRDFSVGPTPGVTLGAAGKGIDWNHGKFQLFPVKPLKEV